MFKETFRESTQATEYQKHQRLPPDFSTILKEYTREILREQPEDILSWSTDYFKHLALSNGVKRFKKIATAERIGASCQKLETQMTLEEAEVMEAFAAMDQKCTGKLFVYLVKRAFMESMNLSRGQALYILSCDNVHIDDNSLTDYRVLTQHALPAIKYFQQSNYIFESDGSDIIDGEVAVYGMTREDVEGTLMRCAAEADEDGLGKITFAVYKNTLENAPMDLTRRDINVLLVEAGVNKEGAIDITKEVKNAFDLLLLARLFTKFDQDNQEQ